MYKGFWTEQKHYYSVAKYMVDEKIAKRTCQSPNLDDANISKQPVPVFIAEQLNVIQAVVQESQKIST